ncbi:GAF and ANTAR domain-containing protein [Actinospica durhamensis]|uniref:GAF and ANTAR domain-containing protein n=1 Tax=Actinospica durhamensis TaxID=1508375 RepID=A0A941ENJ8_9ACTN|nr:GAF and ANTAR domain-containing protein [Actinospica durhamensis]MBR7834526.1 GAF and ANTAR domain-containing protein [Actinospica durhamensis]
MTGEQQLIEVLVEAAEALVDGFDVIDYLHTVSERCVDLLPVEAAGVMLVDERHRLRPAAAFGESARLSELLELQADAGPCLQVFRTGAPVVSAELEADTGHLLGFVEEVGFAEEARIAGFASVHALPLRLRVSVIGALALFSSRPGPLSDSDFRAGRALANVATIGILAQRDTHQPELLAARLQQALASRVMIEQAKGVVAERLGITVDEAFAQLRLRARDHELHLSDLARDVVRSSGLPDA